MLTKTQSEQFKSKNNVVIKISKTHMKKFIGGSHLFSLIRLPTKIAPKVGPVLAKTALLWITAGIASSLASPGVDKLFSCNGIIDDIVKELFQIVTILNQENNKVSKDQKKQFDGLGRQRFRFITCYWYYHYCSRPWALVSIAHHQIKKDPYRMPKTKIPIV